MNGYGRAGGKPAPNGVANGGGAAPAAASIRKPTATGAKASGGGGSKFFGERLVFLLVAAVFRRKGVLLLAPLLYIVGMVMYMGTLGLDSVPGAVGVAILRRAPPPGAVYKSARVFEKLWPDMQADGGNSSLALATAWHTKAGAAWKPCAEKKVFRELPDTNGYLIVEANGGLNQQRLSISDAVAVAGLLNATLVIPYFHFNSVWRDSSKFRDIFDEEYFIDRLKDHVRIVREIPAGVFERFDRNMSNIVNLRVKAWSSKSYYMQKVLPKLVEDGAIRIAPFSSRLAHTVPSDIQRLRCLANFEALRFSRPIRTLAEKMVERMLRNSSASGGKYISVHLRFEKDMVAFSLCVYDGGKEEKREMDEARERGWRGKFKRPHRALKPTTMRMNGKCPLTPLEVGIILRGMGFDNTTSVYVASGKIYKAEKYMAPLRQLFPRLETKETLATEDELAPFMNHSSRLAALDYTVCLYSEVFLTTQGGNFPHFMMGHRRYLYEGHARTINPDKRKLVLSLDNPNISWERLKQHMQEMLRRSDNKGVEMRKPNASLYTFPMPDCMCKQGEEE